MRQETNAPLIAVFILSVISPAFGNAASDYQDALKADETSYEDTVREIKAHPAAYGDLYAQALRDAAKRKSEDDERAFDDYQKAQQLERQQAQAERESRRLARQLLEQATRDSDEAARQAKQAEATAAAHEAQRKQEDAQNAALATRQRQLQQQISDDTQHIIDEMGAKQTQANGTHSSRGTLNSWQPPASANAEGLQSPAPPLPTARSSPSETATGILNQVNQIESTVNDDTNPSQAISHLQVNTGLGDSQDPSYATTGSRQLEDPDTVARKSEHARLQIHNNFAQLKQDLNAVDESAAPAAPATTIPPTSQQQLQQQLRDLGVDK